MQMIVLSVALPIVIYDVMTDAGFTPVVALVVSSVGPLLDIGITWARTRRLDEFAVVVLAFLVLGIIVSLIFDDPRLLLLKEAAITGVIGILALGSLVVAPRPLMFYFGRRFATGGDPARVEWWNGLWRFPGFRRTQVVITTVWGVVFLAEAVVRGILTYTLSVDTMVVVNNVAPLVIVALLVVWTALYAKRQQRIGEAHGVVVEPPVAPA
ncbi:VC0807 family protein [Pseudonocardia endophytica]|nr:VC0807 family protein [Pseudonocardia endophytica]